MFYRTYTGIHYQGYFTTITSPLSECLTSTKLRTKPISQTCFTLFPTSFRANPISFGWKTYRYTLPANGFGLKAISFNLLEHSFSRQTKCCHSNTISNQTEELFCSWKQNSFGTIDSFYSFLPNSFGSDTKRFNSNTISFTPNNFSYGCYPNCFAVQYTSYCRAVNIIGADKVLPLFPQNSRPLSQGFGAVPTR